MAIKGSENGLGNETRNNATMKAGPRKKAVAGRGAARTPSRSGKMPSITVRKASFLAVLRDTANVSRAARESGLSSSAAYRHRARHAQFAADWDAAVAEALDELEDSLTGGQSLLETVAAQLLLHGNAYVQVLRDAGGRPLADV